MIHLDILSRILDVTMAVCDLSAVNPNVMFELGIRQAFDKPVVLLKDRGTRDVFDIGPIRRVDYDEALTYRGVMEARLALTKMLEATAAMKIGEGTNSIVNLLGLRAAAVRPSEQDPQTARFTLLESAFGEISEDLKYLRRMVSRYIDRPRNMSGTRNMDLDARQVNLMLSTGSSVSIRAKVYEAFKEEIEHLLSRSLQDAQEIFSSFNENKRHIIYEMLGDERKTYFKDLL